ncbi:MAG: hypothetical protein GXP19_10085 [Gammaproteobacteria bacterium]|nr:hypothetical protein [Gammaproteobacteria bacterium]
MSKYLVWRVELANEKNAQSCSWSQAGSNLALNFHGDPYSADVTVLSDGNHHMALQEALSGFVSQDAKTTDVFYVTLPPQVLMQIVKNNELYLGHLRLPIRPNIMLSPPAIIEQLLGSGKLSQSVPFIKNRGNVLLVRKGNPKKYLE